ncbi:MAG: hypothetical protein N4A59_06310 [Marinifilum sp.]|jgi:transcriptional regulator with XRE-family HTH domain|nr:hypothetical protein [Marinifilum sp.]
MSVSERISRVCDVKKIRQVDLILNRLASKQTISNIMRGVQKPGYDFLEKFIKLFPDLNARWLFTGEGEMFGEEITNVSITGGTNVLADDITQYKGKGNVIGQKNDGAAEKELKSLRKELAHRNDTIELLVKENEKKDKIINKLLDK